MPNQRCKDKIFGIKYLTHVTNNNYSYIRKKLYFCILIIMLELTLICK